VFYSGLSVYIEAFVTFTKSESGDDKKTITEQEKEPAQASAPSTRGGEVDDDDDDDEKTSLGATKEKTLINLRILPARESKYYAVKSLLSFGGTDKLATD